MFHKLEREKKVEDDIYLLRAEQQYLHRLSYLHQISASPLARPVLPPIGEKERQLVMRSDKGDIFLIM
jgi:hypothetical protein